MQGAARQRRIPDALADQRSVSNREPHSSQFLTGACCRSDVAGVGGRPAQETGTEAGEAGVPAKTGDPPWLRGFGARAGTGSSPAKLERSHKGVLAHARRRAEP